jgi:DNA-binding transcriptional regulator YdaS (Cro superfamily)
MPPYIDGMADFVTVAFRASRALGGPCRLARRLGVEPDALYRWMAGQDLPAKEAQRDMLKRMTLAEIAAPALPPAGRRHGDL